MNYTHIGWTPCISGHLNFGLMTPGIFGGFTNNTIDDERRTTINYGYKCQDNHHARRIVLQSKINWQDTPNPNMDGNFRVILIAEANEENNLDARNLEGSLYIYPLKNEPKKIDGKINLPWFDIIHSSNRTLYDFRKKILNADKSEEWYKIKDELNTQFDDLKICLEDNSSRGTEDHFYKVDFHVNPRGMTQLKLDNVQNSTNEYVILRQAFYYIKYALHSHKHHHTEEDSLTTIVQNEPVKRNDVGLRLIGQLKRELTSIKRTYSNGGNKVFCDEQGIIAYMSSFYTSLHQDNYLSTEQYERENVYLKSIKDSFVVQIEKQSKKGEKEKEIKNTYRTYLALFLTIFSLLWVTVIEKFTKFQISEANTLKLNFTESLTLFLTFLICLICSYLFQTKRIIKNTLDTQGLRTWVEQYYITKDEEFKKRVSNEKKKAILIGFITAMFFFFSPLGFKYLSETF